MTVAGPLRDDDGDSAVRRSPVKAVIFDLDGTLLDTESLSCRAIIESFAAMDLPIPPDVLASLGEGGWLLPWELKRRILGLRGSEWVPIVLGYARERWGVDISSGGGEEGGGHREELVTAFWATWEARLNGLCSEVEACPGAPELVAALRAARVPMAIATSSRAAVVEKKRLKHEEMFQSFQEIVCGDDPNVHNGKPAPDIYLEAAKRLGLEPFDCLVFEDALTGAQAGRSAGCRVVAVPDSRIEVESFSGVSEETLADMWHFNGEEWGIPLDMTKLKR
ncbi:hypothetical protein ACHAWF_005821 [Thalassiosira exigua]